MPNVNCLEGWKCPKCGAEQSFRVFATCLIHLNDDGIEDSDDAEWGDESAVMCNACPHTGTVADFTETDGCDCPASLTAQDLHSGACAKVL